MTSTSLSFTAFSTPTSGTSTHKMDSSSNSEDPPSRLLLPTAWLARYYCLPYPSSPAAPRQKDLRCPHSSFSSTIVWPARQRNDRLISYSRYIRRPNTDWFFLLHVVHPPTLQVLPFSACPQSCVLSPPLTFCGPICDVKSSFRPVCWPQTSTHAAEESPCLSCALAVVDGSLSRFLEERLSVSPCLCFSFPHANPCLANSNIVPGPPAKTVKLKHTLRHCMHGRGAVRYV